MPGDATSGDGGADAACVGAGCARLGSGWSASTDSATDAAAVAGEDAGAGAEAGAGAGSGSNCGSAGGAVFARRAGTSAAAATALRRVRKEMPDRKSTSESSVSSRNVEVPNFGHSRNSAAAAPNTTNDSKWSVRNFAPGRAPLMTSHSNSSMPSASSTSLNVTGHSAPDSKVSLNSGSAKETLGIRKATML